ncbi:MAG: CZB domain-containing protein [Gammaproteobacteria bacterium]|nr:CZB domain-containing protein [Gammaproteobacteria bacterium]
MLIDINHARITHLEWEFELEDILSGRKRNHNDVTSHDECMLGTWLYREGLKRYGHIAELVLLEKHHTTFHREAKKVLREHQLNNSEAANVAFAEVQSLSREIIFLLTVVEYRIIKRQQKVEAIKHPIRSLRRILFG